ncbi:MAG: hypothetical protein UHY90_08040 [Treponema sp.]|nr:hypothetical protein [Treponema sp.]
MATSLSFLYAVALKNTFQVSSCKVISLFSLQMFLNVVCHAEKYKAFVQHLHKVALLDAALETSSG